MEGEINSPLPGKFLSGLYSNNDLMITHKQ